MWEARHGTEQHQGEQQSPLAGELWLLGSANPSTCFKPKWAVHITPFCGSRRWIAHPRAQLFPLCSQLVLRDAQEHPHKLDMQSYLHVSGLKWDVYPNITTWAHHGVLHVTVTCPPRPSPSPPSLSGAMVPTIWPGIPLLMLPGSPCRSPYLSSPCLGYLKYAQPPGEGLLCWGERAPRISALGN